MASNCSQPFCKSCSITSVLAELGPSALVIQPDISGYCEVYKYTHGMYKTEAGELFEFNQSATRGHSLKLQKERFHTEVWKNFFSNRVFPAWNSLPEEIVSASSLSQFKKYLRSLRKDLRDYSTKSPSYQVTLRHEKHYGATIKYGQFVYKLWVRPQNPTAWSAIIKTIPCRCDLLTEAMCAPRASGICQHLFWTRVLIVYSFGIWLVEWPSRFAIYFINVYFNQRCRGKLN